MMKFLLQLPAWISMFVLLTIPLPVYAIAPSITGFLPDNGKVGDVVTITGLNYYGVSAVKLNGMPMASFTRITDKTITATVPQGATSGQISVTTPDGTVLSSGEFKVWIPSTLDIEIDPGYGYNAAFNGLSLTYSLTGPRSYTGTITTDGVGKSTIGSLRPGSYTLRFDGSHWLRRSITGIDLSSSKSVPVSLANGDSDGDNQVNLFDFVVLDSNFGSSDKMADLDGDGMVNLFDYVVIDSYFGAKGDAYVQTKVNPLDGAEMVWVPEGEFLMGNTSGNFNEWPQRSVYLDGYWIYKYEVTVAQYRQFCLAISRPMPAEPAWGWQDSYPMVFVDWQNAADYATWAGVKLPTEAQWEKASRCTDGRVYPWGDMLDVTKFVNSSNSPSSPRPGGSYPSGVSFYGCMDMSGNVYEWCSDWYSVTYYQVAPNTNPLGPASANSRVMRGGAWSSGQSGFRSAQRDYAGPSYSNHGTGFRCATVD
ncbi:MAG: SUMF1/EgtB/PvdO family nonheme iron enzyme [Armatimonadota bacterium]